MCGSPTQSWRWRMWKGKRINLTFGQKFGQRPKKCNEDLPLLESQSPRLSNIAEKMAGKSEANYKAIQRFLAHVDVKKQLLRLFQEEAGFVIGDPTEMPRDSAP